MSATDWMASPILEPIPGNTLSLFLVGESYQELKSIFDKLPEGADPDKRTFQELHSVPLGSYGQFTDTFGVSWIFKADKADE